ncbi:hypothetical protein B0H11DRAFT_1914787 [Mycena galericulata]|nr:hypothetical protein B0H11DRAFT_1914787 [Mycena galericulata]
MLLRLPASVFLLSLSVLVFGSHHHSDPTTASPSSGFGRRSCKSNVTGATTSAASIQTESLAPSSTGVAASGFIPTKPADWPTATQLGPTPAYTVASPSDPYLEELSKAYDNSGVPAFTSVHQGDVTWYAQGLGACGDVYNESSFTAAVSHLMYDAWPGANINETNRNPICGAFVRGRTALNSSGLFTTVVRSSTPGYVEIGGDGLINCAGSASVQCHIPLTATLTHQGKSIQVEIVDHCKACKEGDIDLTPAAFTALATNISIGRTDVMWSFDHWYSDRLQNTREQQHRAGLRRIAFV